jgi:hypothetical protein
MTVLAHIDVVESGRRLRGTFNADTPRRPNRLLAQREGGSERSRLTFTAESGETFRVVNDPGGARVGVNVEVVAYPVWSPQSVQSSDEQRLWITYPSDPDLNQYRKRRKPWDPDLDAWRTRNMTGWRKVIYELNRRLREWLHHGYF